MRQGIQLWRLAAAAAACVCIGGLTAGASAQTSTSTDIKSFEVVSVDGNKVVAKTAGGAKEYTLPADFKFTTADGKEVGVADLKPGMKGVAHVTTKTTTTPVYVTEVKNGEVIQKSGNSIIVRSDAGIKMFSEGDMAKRNITIMKDGKPAGISDFSTGDRLTATIVTAGTPKVLTEQQLQATLSGSGAGAGSAGAASRASASGATPAAEGAPARKLPKTASQLPLVGLIGALSLAAGLSLTIARKRRNQM